MMGDIIDIVFVFVLFFFYDNVLFFRDKIIFFNIVCINCIFFF